MQWLIGQIVLLINNIFAVFKKSETEEAEEKNQKRQREISKEIDEASNLPH